MAKYTITANVEFEVEADSPQQAADLGFFHIEDGAKPTNMLVWDENPAHWFADRYTYEAQPKFIEPNPQGVGSIAKPAKVEEPQVKGIA